MSGRLVYYQRKYYQGENVNTHYERQFICDKFLRLELCETENSFEVSNDLDNDLIIVALYEQPFFANESMKKLKNRPTHLTIVFQPLLTPLERF